MKFVFHSSWLTFGCITYEGVSLGDSDPGSRLHYVSNSHFFVISHVPLDFISHFHGTIIWLSRVTLRKNRQSCVTLRPQWDPLMIDNDILYKAALLLVNSVSFKIIKILKPCPLCHGSATLNWFTMFLSNRLSFCEFSNNRPNISLCQQ